MSKLMFEEKEILPEIVDVVFSDETRMPIPEKSYAQELLETPIPLENRIAHLIPYIEPTAELLSSHAIAKRIGAEEYWVSSVAKRIGIELLPNDSGEGAAQLYPPLSLELLDEEWRWQQAYEALDEKISLYKVSQFLARPRQWIADKSAELGVFPEYIQEGRPTFLYEKTIILALRHLILIVPPQGDWHSVADLEELTGVPETRIRTLIAKQAIQSQMRWSYSTARELPHFPPESRETVERERDARPEPAGEWDTVVGAARALSKSPDWVRSRIGPEYEKKELLDDSGKPAIHYKGLVDGLRDEAKKIESYPEAGHFVTLSRLASIVGRSKNWTADRLLDIEDLVMETRLDGRGIPATHYDPETAVILSTFPKYKLKVNTESSSKTKRRFPKRDVVDEVSRKEVQTTETVSPNEQRRERYSERLYNSRKAHNNLSTFLHDPAFSGTQLVNYGLNSIVAEVTAHCDQRTRDIVASYLIGVEILEIESIYNVREGEVGKIISDAAKQVAAGYTGKSRR